MLTQLALFANAFFRQTGTQMCSTLVIRRRPTVLRSDIYTSPEILYQQ